MSEAGDQCQALARNLIDTLGRDRALHVAQQFGWLGVVEEISRQQRTPSPRTPTPPVHA